MGVTLEQMRKTAPTATYMKVIDEFRVNPLMDKLVWEDCGVPGGPGASLSYSYTRTITPSTAAFRDFYEEYAPANAEVEDYVSYLKPFGGTFEIDSALTDVGWLNRVEYELKEKVKAANRTFNNAFINGDSASGGKSFDGLNVALSGSSTDITPATAIDITSDENIKTNSASVVNAISNMLDELDGEPTAMIVNKTMKGKLKAVARAEGVYQTERNSLGLRMDMFDSIPMWDLGEIPGAATPIVPTSKSTGISPIYFIRIGEDGVHGIKKPGEMFDIVSPLNVPTAQNVLKGKVEVVAGTALISSKAAGRYNGLKIGAIFKYKVTYDGNGNTGGAVPTDSTEYVHGSEVTAKGNTSNLAKTGHTFAGWNTAADGSGTDIAATTGKFNIFGDTTLYAKWTSA